MKRLTSWICDGIAKDGEQYLNCTGQHELHENHDRTCAICGLPQAAMIQAGYRNRPQVTPLLIGYTITGTWVLLLSCIGVYQLVSKSLKL